MDMTLIWRGFFMKWPSEMQRAGVVVTSFGEQVGFIEFLMGEHTVLLQRLAPDSVGGRKLILPYANIQGIKITEPVNNEALIPFGFRPANSKSKSKSPARNAPGRSAAVD